MRRIDRECLLLRSVDRRFWTFSHVDLDLRLAVERSRSRGHGRGIGERLGAAAVESRMQRGNARGGLIDEMGPPRCIDEELGAFPVRYTVIC